MPHVPFEHDAVSPMFATSSASQAMLLPITPMPLACVKAVFNVSMHDIETEMQQKAYLRQK
jgi:hypothetical protein